MKNNKLFTLIELLIVVAIIIILISLTQPVYKSMLHKTYAIKCQSHLRQINLFQFAYADDHQDTFPLTNPYNSYNRRMPTALDKVLFYDVFVNDYETNPEILACPNRDTMPNYISDPSSYWYGDYITPYAFVTGLPSVRSSNFYDTIPSAASLKASNNSPEKIMLADVNVQFLTTHSLGSSNHAYEPFQRQTNLHDLLNRIQGSNRIHADGSGKWVTLELMGKDGKSPDPNNSYTARYDHWNNIRPYYW